MHFEFELITTPSLAVLILHALFPTMTMYSLPLEGTRQYKPTPKGATPTHARTKSLVNMSWLRDSGLDSGLRLPSIGGEPKAAAEVRAVSPMASSLLVLYVTQKHYPMHSAPFFNAD